MNKLILLLGVLACLVTIQARHFSDRSAEESSDDQDELRPKERLSRHRRRRWQSNYGFDYSAPSYYPPSNYYPDRRNDRDQEVIQNIYRILEDINAYIRRTPPSPPPLPQPIYIPYPITFPTRVNCRVNKPQNTTSTKNPDVINRNHPAMEDTNQNWGLVMAEEDYEDESDGARPISFDPLVPKQLLKRPAPKVEHGSQQIHQTTIAPKFGQAVPAALGLSLSTSSSSVPGMCSAAILSCCGFSGDKAQQRQCFANIGCLSSYNDGSACTAESIQRSLDSFKFAYSPAAQ